MTMIKRNFTVPKVSEVADPRRLLIRNIDGERIPVRPTLDSQCSLLRGLASELPIINLYLEWIFGPASFVAQVKAVLSSGIRRFS